MTDTIYLDTNFLKRGGNTLHLNHLASVVFLLYLKYLHTDSNFFEETLCLCYFSWKFIDHVSKIHLSDIRSMYLVMSCGSNSFPSYVVKLLYIWPLESFTLTCRCVVQLLVCSLIKHLLFYFLPFLIKSHLRHVS